MTTNIFLDLPAGIKMPALGLGTWQCTDENELKTALDAALEAGYRHIDTAYIYGNEKIIGNILKKWFESGKLKREDLFITTKLPMQGIHPDRVEFFIKRSLENLQLNYVDLYLVHSPVGFKWDEKTGAPLLDDKKTMILEGKTDHLGLWKKLEEQVDCGRTKAIGLSNYRLDQIQTILNNAKIKPANLQVEIHVFLQQRKLVDFCHKNGISVTAYSPLGSPGINKFRRNMGQEEQELPDILGNKIVNEIAKKYSKTPAQIVLRFLLQRGLAAIPKSVTVKRVQENISVFDFAISDNDMKELYDLEVGEEARVCNFKRFKGLEQHPDFPGAEV